MAPSPSPDITAGSFTITNAAMPGHHHQRQDQRGHCKEDARWASFSDLAASVRWMMYWLKPRTGCHPHAANQHPDAWEVAGCRFGSSQSARRGAIRACMAHMPAPPDTGPTPNTT